MIQTVDSMKLATALHKAVEKEATAAAGGEACARTPLKILIQVNTSGEESESVLESTILMLDKNSTAF